MACDYDQRMALRSARSRGAGRLRRPDRTRRTCSLFTACCLVLFPVLSSAADDVSMEEWHRLTRCANEAWQPATPEDVLNACRALQAALVPTDRFLNLSPAYGATWREFLQLRWLDRQLADPLAADPDQLDECRQRLAAAAPLFPSVAGFAEADRRLQQLAQLLRRMAGDESEYQRHLQRLETALLELAAETDDDTERQVAEEMAWLDQRALAESFVGSIREVYCKPNAYVSVSRRLIEVLLPQTTVVEAPFNDVIFGTRYRGLGRTATRTSVEFIPDARNITVCLCVDAGTSLASRGVNGRLVVDSVGATQVRSQSILRAGETGFEVQPSAAQAAVDTRITRLCYTGIVGRSMATRRALHEQPATEEEVSRRAERLACEELERQWVQPVRNARETFVRRIRKPLVLRDQFPHDVAAQTSMDRLLVSMVQANREQLGASSLPAPDFGNGDTPDLWVQLHESYVNNLATGLLCGATVSEVELGQQLEQLWGYVPAGLQAATLDKAWSVTFGEERPLYVRFEGGHVTIGLRATGFDVGGTPYPGAEIVAAYSVTDSESGWIGERIDGLKISLSVSREADQPLGARQQVFRSMLRHRFERLLPERFALSELPLPEGWKTHKPVRAAACTAREGWLTLSCRVAE